jgi:nitrogen regulatory protein PII
MEVYRGVEYEVQFLPKVKIEVAVPAEKLDDVLDAIQKGAKTGEIGDGKIFIYDIQDAVRIRTGERGKEAL